MWKFRISAMMAFCFILSMAPGSPAQSDFFSKFRNLRSDGKSADALSLVELQITKVSEPALIAELQMARGMLYLDMAMTEKAEQAFELASSVHSVIEEHARWQLATLLIKEAKWDLAHKQLQTLMKLSPNAKMQAQAQFEMAKIEMEQKHFRDARFVLQKQERKNRHEEFYPELIFQLARAERGLNNHGAFCKWARKLYAHYPDYSGVSSWDFSLAGNIFLEKPTECGASSDDKRARIKNLQWAGQSQKAKDEIDALKKGNSEERAEGERLEIAYLIHEGDVEKAMDLLRPQYATHKHDANFLMQIGNVVAKTGDMNAAVGSFYSAYKASPRGKFGKQALYQAAFMSYEFQDYDGAARRFQEFMRVFPGSGLTRDARWHLAWIRYLRGDFTNAYKALSDLQSQIHKSRRAASFFAPDRVQYWMAMCLYRMNRFSEARPIFERLAADKLMGFYSMASASRLKKVDEYMPKLPKYALSNTGFHGNKFQTMSYIVPAEDPDWFRDVAAQKMNGTDAGVNADASSAAAAAPASEEAESEQQLMAGEQGPDRGDQVAEDAKDDSKEEETVTPFSNPILVKRFERAKALTELGMTDWARWELFDIEKRTSNRDYLRSLMEQYEIVGSYNRSSYIGQVTFGAQRAAHGIEGGRGLWEHAFPKAYGTQVSKYSHEFNVPTELIWGIMRAESQYKRDVVSPVGALGLMQVMPFTATKVAGLLGEKDFESRKLMQPENAVRIGSRYLLHLMKQFDSNYALVAAGYNAGPHRVKAWLVGFGQLELDEFIEHIPYLETRNYVKKVLTNFNTYARLYGNKRDEPIALSEAIRTQVSGPLVAKETWEEL